MSALVLHSDQSKTRGAARGSAVVVGCRRASTIDHRKVQPERHRSSPAGGRSLMVGCAFGRETRAQVLRSHRAIRPTRRFILGWTGDLNAIADVRTRTYSGIDERLAALLVANQFGSQPRRQASADLPEVHSEASLRRLVRVDPDANENGLTHAQILFAPGAKTHV